VNINDALAIEYLSTVRLNGQSDLQRQWTEVKDETPLRYAHTEIRTPVVGISDPTRYQLDYGDLFFS